MGTTEKVRWTIVIQSRDGGVPRNYGVYTSREQAKAQAQQWQGVFNKRYAAGTAPVVSLAPVYPAVTSFRDMHWT